VHNEQRLTLAMTFEAKSPTFDVSMPLSTTATAGAAGAGPRMSPVFGSVRFQSGWMSVDW